MPSPGVRMAGVFFPANGKFYAMGGRAFDGGGGEFTSPLEYDPANNSWTTKSATYPDNQVNNIACGVLTDSGTPYIYCVGGSESLTSTVTGRVFRYNPVTDTISDSCRSLACGHPKRPARRLQRPGEQALHSGWVQCQREYGC